jgi:hypothetical protein
VPVQPAIDGQRLAQLGWPIEQVAVLLSGAPGSHYLHTFHGICRPDQHRRRKTCSLCDRIQTVVQAVNQIDVGQAAGAIHGPVARAGAAGGMAGQIVLTHVSLDLADTAGQPLPIHHAHQGASQQVARDIQGWALKKAGR